MNYHYATVKRKQPADFYGKSNFVTILVDFVNVSEKQKIRNGGGGWGGGC